MRVVNGSLVVCLSKYLPLRSVYILVIKFESPCLIFTRSEMALRSVLLI